MQKVLLVLLCLIAPHVAFAQGSTSHVFPQIADGRQPDGSFYTSRLFITNISGFSSTCTINIIGFGNERLLSSPTVVVQTNSWATVVTSGQAPLASGYARLDCSQPVFASLTYSLLSAAETPLGMATVLSSRVSSDAVFPMVLNGNYKYGFAIANDNDVPLVAILFLDANGGGQGQTITIGPRSQYVRFVDDIFNVPNQGTGTLEIGANGSVGSGSFHVIGLLFDRGVFTTLVPATVP